MGHRCLGLSYMCCARLEGGGGGIVSGWPPSCKPSCALATFHFLRLVVSYKGLFKLCDISTRDANAWPKLQFNEGQVGEGLHIWGLNASSDELCRSAQGTPQSNPTWLFTLWATWVGMLRGAWSIMVHLDACTLYTKHHPYCHPSLSLMLPFSTVHDRLRLTCGPLTCYCTTFWRERCHSRA